MRALITALAATTLFTPVAQAATIMPLDRATILAASPFDFKVELDAVHPEPEIAVTVNGQPYAEVFGKPADYVAEEKDEDGTVLHSQLVDEITSEPDYDAAIAALG